MSSTNAPTVAPPPPDKVQVVCRLRPVDEYAESCVSFDEGDGGDIVEVKGTERSFSVTKAFGERSRQQDIFEHVGKPSVNYVLQGFGACVFAYGQTGSGKTFTMTGTQDSPGLVPRMIEAVFSELVRGFRDFSVKCQYVEIYMEKVRDLFNPTRARNPWEATGPKINVRFDGKHVQIENAKSLSFGRDPALRADAKDDEQVVQVLSKQLLNHVLNAGRHRTVRSHLLNAESSRSHAVLLLEVNASRTDANIASSLMLVDLAGSENIGKAGVEGVGKEEAKSINKSLFSLTRCIEALAGGQKVPFRESVLTMILKPALDGRSCCTLIAALRGEHATETRDTLKFTETALKVKVKPKQTSSEALGVVREQAQDLRGEVRALKQEIAWLKQNDASSKTFGEMLKKKEAALQAKVDALTALQHEIREQEDQLSSVQRELAVSKREVEQERAARLRAEAELQLLQAQLDDAQARSVVEGHAQRLKAQRQFEEGTETVLRGLKLAHTSGNFEQALQIFGKLLQHFESDLEARIDENTHHAHRTLLSEFKWTIGWVGDSLRTWHEVKVRLSDLKFVMDELLVQSERIAVFGSPTPPNSSADIATYHAALEEMWRLCRHASTTWFGFRNGPSTTRAEDDVSAEFSESTAGLQALLLNIGEYLSNGLVVWTRYALVWKDHWSPRLDVHAGHEAARNDGETEKTGDLFAFTPRQRSCAEDGLQRIGEPLRHGLRVPELGPDTKCVTTVADEIRVLMELFNAFIDEFWNGTFKTVFGNDIKHQNGDSESGAISVQRACLKFLELQSREVGVAGAAEVPEVALDANVALAILDECRSADVGNTFCSDFTTPLIEERADDWRELSGLAQTCSENPSDGVEVLREYLRKLLMGMHMHQLCEEGSLDRCLMMPSAAFIRDVVKFMLCGSSRVCEGIFPSSFDWDATWSFEQASADEMCEFFKRVGQVVEASCARWLWPIRSHDVTPKLLSQSGDVTKALLLIAELAVVVRTSAAEQAGVDGYASRTVGMANSVTALCDWMRRLREKVFQVATRQRAEAERRLVGSEQDVGSLQTAIKTLLSERDQLLQGQREWDAERRSLMQDLSRARNDREAAVANVDTKNQESLRQLREEMEGWKSRAELEAARAFALEKDLRHASNNEVLRSASEDVIANHLASTSRMWQMVRETSDTVAASEGGQEVQDLISCCDRLLKSHLEVLREISGEKASKKAKVDLEMVGGFIKGARASKRLRDAKTWAQNGEGDDTAQNHDETNALAADGLEASVDEFTNASAVEDRADSEERERFRMVLLALAEEHAAVDSVRMQEERAFVRYLRAALRKSWCRRHESDRRIAHLEGTFRSAKETDGEGRRGGEEQLASLPLEVDRERLLSLARRKRSIIEAKVTRLVELDDVCPEFCQLKAHVECTASSGHKLRIVVTRVRRIENPRLEADFYEGVADQVEPTYPPFVIKNVFHGSHGRICELIAEEGFCLPKDLDKKPGKYGNAVHLANYAFSAKGHCSAASGRWQSLLVCDISPGRVLVPSACGAVLAKSGLSLPNMDRGQLRALRGVDDVAGWDTVFIAGTSAGGCDVSDDEYAIYDTRVALPRYIVDFDIQGFGSENQECDQDEVARLREELQALQHRRANDGITEIKTKCRQIASFFSSNDSDFRLVDVQRHQDPLLWQRCSDRLLHGIADGPGLAAGLEVILTRLERIVNPNLACRFYERMSQLFYPEEASALLFHNGDSACCAKIAKNGFIIPMPQSQGSDEEENKLYGQGVYFAMSVWKLSGCSLGSHRLLLCEVALGKPMLAQSRRPTLDLSSIQRAGFDSLHAIRGIESECDEWVIYDTAQALPVFIISYDVQPKAAAADLLKEVAALEEGRRRVDEQMAAVLQELEDARRDAEQTRLRLDERLAQQLVEEEEHLQRTKQQSQAQQVHLDNRQADQLQELERAKRELDQMKAKLSAMEQQRVAVRETCSASATSPMSVSAHSSQHTASERFNDSPTSHSASMSTRGATGSRLSAFSRNGTTSLRRNGA
eukprot:TRINITY_DN31774_c0_g1_i1.p1 TRINITY_DN31774_c0_g1~~TRINITY_DN31774_c0_g1_i1.p1  ORF type:complete len:2025 (-),score=382.94 TRINITY_DN31774_c0_g1_i1:88-6162(-)